MMDQLVAGFSKQMREALVIARNANVGSGKHPVTSILICGMGGSGIGANFTASFVASVCPVPIFFSKGYEVPAFAGEHTLAICSSYSGSTEETLAAYKTLQQRGAKIVAIASGGPLIELAKEDGHDYVMLPGGIPSPRACLGYSVVAQLGVLIKLGLAPSHLLDDVDSAALALEEKSQEIMEKARHLAAALVDKIPVIYTTDRSEALAVRFRQQLNENSKMLCWHHVIPEQNHNELVGWREENSKLAVIFLRHKDDLPRNQSRLELVKEVVSNFAGTVIELWSKGDNFIERTFYLVHLVDWCTVYLAEMRKVDVDEIKVIDYLKSTLSKEG